MDYNINITDLQLSQQILGYDGLKIKQSLKDKITEEENMLDLINFGISHCDKQIANHIKLQKEGRNKEAAIYEKTKNIFISNKYIWNIAGFITLVSIDIKTIQLGMYFAENEWHKRFYARQSCVIMYESCNDILELLGKDFKNKTSNIANIEDFVKPLNDIRKELNEFKNQHMNYLQKVRNHTIAHKDKDVLKQLNIIVDINWSKIIELTTSFEETINNLGNITKQLIELGINQLGLEAQLINRIE